MSVDYKDTLNLPRTTFPMRANLAKREPEFLKFWNDTDVYNKLIEKGKDKPSFILHDGPPYANANIHIGTAFNKILKDFIPKYKWMKGFYSPYVPGWDTHGLPIELHVLKSRGKSKDELEPVELRKQCTDWAYKYRDIQREEFKRLGVIGDWDNPYMTLKPEYEAAQIGVFADMVEKDLVYKGQKPVYWCIDCQTALAAAEIEYWDESSPSIFVAYSIPHITEYVPEFKDENVNVVVWTTTPWTLPASMAVALNPNFEYVFVKAEGKIYLLAKGLLNSVKELTGLDFSEPLKVFKGKELEGLVARHPFYEEREIPLVMADYVLLDQGTGCVHTAPGHGVEDYETGIRYNIDIYNPVDGTGHFLPETPIVGGKSLEEGASIVLGLLTESGRLLGNQKMMHSYPHCWRCKKPVIFRSTEQWFVNVDKFRKLTLDIIDNNVKWIPDWGKDRIFNMVRDRSDWCISRQRIWGVPIPAFYCEDCGKTVVTPDRIRKVQSMIREHGSDIWWELTPEELLGDLAFCPHCQGSKLRKEKDIMDVWFDSGVSHTAVLETRDELHWPAELYLEGSDQHRGWFQTSLLTSVATRSKAPYEQVLTHGFIVDGEGKKMSKSLGNSVKPQEIIEKYGADILRLWVASTDYRNDIRISQTIIKNLTESYRRIRNTIRFLLGNLNDFVPSEHGLAYADMEEMDRWIISILNGVIEKTNRAYDEYEFHVPTFIIHQFCVNELSSFYLDASKDRLYADSKDSDTRRSCQTALWIILNTLTRLMAPVLSFTTEETWQEMRKIDASLSESIFLSDWPEMDNTMQDAELEERWSTISTIKGSISKALEKARTEGIIGHPLEAQVILQCGTPSEMIDRYSPEEWATFNIVSDFKTGTEDEVNGCSITYKDEDLSLLIGINKAPGEKCPRCWKYSENTDEDGLCPRCSGVMKN